MAEDVEGKNTKGRKPHPRKGRQQAKAQPVGLRVVAGTEAAPEGVRVDRPGMLAAGKATNALS